MKIKDLLQKETLIFSFEIFPPMRDGDITELFTTIKELVKVDPNFISVTYGAGGSTQDMTFEIASRIKNHVETEVLTHLTCVQATEKEILEILDHLERENIRNILALRGDPPKGEHTFTKIDGGFGYANELVEFIRAHGDFSIGVAGYPEGHVEAPDIDTDIQNLKKKVDAGADFIITQLFFNNDDFYRFRDKAVSKGITVPIIPGIFPIFNFKQIAKIASLCGAAIPKSLFDQLSAVSDRSDEVARRGIDHAIRQSEDLLGNDIPGLHFYSMNKSNHVTHIIRQLNIDRKVHYESEKRITGGTV
ncbi:MAG: methylenetetrahydrofolate reductase [NAD(P)H] [Deltaproteobacteria bacterium]|nr:methylenetetrahydrofolate reductase [NAD(P)H] [Deltaproteobacteria bacterium]MBN2687510.1 methylenetetrahydrofolate reductase [NAD(P)H] [Deltaproteobacteria bacterium]